MTVSSATSAARRVRLGMLTPSSNTTLEPVTAALLADLPEVSAHFARFRVTEIALTAGALGQFDDGEILRAAELLAHAKVDVIGWSGTSASWLGFDADERLVRRITEATGIAACTSVLAINELFARDGVRRFGLVSPYLGDVQARIVANYAAAGFECVAERHLDIQDNFSFAMVDEAQLRTMVQEVAGAGAQPPDGIVVMCTNLRGAPLAAELEAETGITLYDSVAAVTWQALRIAGVDAARVCGWGRLFGA